MNSRGGACSPADSDVDNIHFGTERFYLFDARALDDFYFYSSFSYSSYLLERKWTCSFSSHLSFYSYFYFTSPRHPNAVVASSLSVAASCVAATAVTASVSASHRRRHHLSSHHHHRRAWSCTLLPPPPRQW
jgi:hypothetical protein